MDTANFFGLVSSSGEGPSALASGPLAVAVMDPARDHVTQLSFDGGASATDQALLAVAFGHSGRVAVSRQSFVLGLSQLATEAIDWSASSSPGYPVTFCFFSVSERS